MFANESEQKRCLSVFVEKLDRSIHEDGSASNLHQFTNGGNHDDLAVNQDLLNLVAYLVHG